MNTAQGLAPRHCLRHAQCKAGSEHSSIIEETQIALGTQDTGTGTWGKVAAGSHFCPAGSQVWVAGCSLEPAGGTEIPCSGQRWTEPSALAPPQALCSSTHTNGEEKATAGWGGPRQACIDQSRGITVLLTANQ